MNDRSPHVPDVRDVLASLPHVRNPLSGEDLRSSEWMRAARTYPMYERAAAVLKPRTLLEIGVLLGFGLVSFLRGWSRLELVVGVDNEHDFPGSLRMCGQNLAYAAAQAMLPQDEPAWRLHRSLEEIRGERFDVAHVDGDHSFAGALHDMAYAWGMGVHVMLVDDYLHLEPVREAVHAFSKHQGVRFRVWNTDRGWAVFARDGERLPEEL